MISVYNKHNSTLNVLRTRFLYWKPHSQARSLYLLFRFLIRQQLVGKYRTPALSMKYCLSISGRVHTYPDSFESATVSFRIRLPFTRIR